MLQGVPGMNGDADRCFTRGARAEQQIDKFSRVSRSNSAEDDRYCTVQNGYVQ